MPRSRGQRPAGRLDVVGDRISASPTSTACTPADATGRDILRRAQSPDSETIRGSRRAAIRINSNVRAVSTCRVVEIPVVDADHRRGWIGCGDRQFVAVVDLHQHPEPEALGAVVEEPRDRLGRAPRRSAGSRRPRPPPPRPPGTLSTMKSLRRIGSVAARRRRGRRSSRLPPKQRPPRSAPTGPERRLVRRRSRHPRARRLTGSRPRSRRTALVLGDHRQYRAPPEPR